jgi:hypothetical protein
VPRERSPTDPQVWHCPQRPTQRGLSHPQPEQRYTRRAMGPTVGPGPDTTLAAEPGALTAGYRPAVPMCVALLVVAALTGSFVPARLEDCG